MTSVPSVRPQWAGAVRRTEDAVLLVVVVLAVPLRNGDRRTRRSLFSAGGFELLDAFQGLCSQFGGIACDRELTATLDLG